MTTTVYAARVWEKVTVTGTGSVTCSGTVQQGGYATFASSIPVGSQVPYYIGDSSASAWEAGMGVYSGTAPGSFTRAPVASSNGGALVSFAGNVCDVVVNLLPPITATNGAQQTGLLPATNPDGFLDESFSRFPALNLKPRNQLQTLIAGKIMINSQVNAPVRCKIGLIGDSTGMGYGGLPNNFLQHSITAYMAQALAAAGYNSTYDSNFGTGNENNSDSRLVMTGNTSAPIGSLAGGAYQLSAAGTLLFTPNNAWDTVDILGYNQNGIGPMSLIAGSVTTPFGTLNQTQLGVNPTIQTFSTGAAPAVQTLSIGWTSGSIDVLGIICYNSKAPAIEVYNFAGGNQPSATYASTSPAYGALNAILQTGVQAVFYELGINDGITNVTPAAFGTNVLSCVNALQAAGIEVILMMPPIVPGASYSTTLFPGYLKQLQAIALSNNVPLINWMDVYGNGLALGSDAGQPHPDNAVYQDKANYIVRNIFQTQALAINTLGSLIPVAASTPLTPAQNNSLAQLSVAGVTVTLPPAASYPNYKYTVQATFASGIATVASSGGSFVGPDIATASTITLIPGSALQFRSDGTSWQSFVTGGKSGSAVFLAAGSITIPQWAKNFRLLGVGGGASGAGGITLPNATTAGPGGGGGGTGGLSDTCWLPISALPQLTGVVTIGAGGAQAAANANGNAGSNTICVFGSKTFTFNGATTSQATPGSTAVNSTGGWGGAAPILSATSTNAAAVYFYNGGAVSGGACARAGTPTNGANTSLLPTAGGGGGGATGTVYVAGGNSGYGFGPDLLAVQGNGGTTSGAAGSNGANAIAWPTSATAAGGGGGAGNLGGAGGAGGSGGQPGAGGGGGGAGTTIGGTGGAGGAGGLMAEWN
jgi:hypothetical protein